MNKIEVNCIHLQCPNCGTNIDIKPATGTVMLNNKDEEVIFQLFRDFIRTNHLSKEWENFLAINGTD